MFITANIFRNLQAEIVEKGRDWKPTVNMQHSTKSKSNNSNPK